MKILFTTFSYLPERSGIPSVVKYLAEGLSGKGHEVEVVTCRNGNDFPYMENINNVKVKRFDLFFDKFKRISGNVNDYVTYIVKQKVDFLIMECLQCVTTDALLPHLNQIKGKVIIHAHGAPGIYEKPFKIMYDLKHTIGHTYNWWKWRRYYNTVFPRYSKYIDARISCSICASDLDYFHKHIINNYILENSADYMFFFPQIDKTIKDKLGIKSSKYIINIATINDRKNQVLLIESFVKANLSDCALVIIGTERSKYFEKICKLANKYTKQKQAEIHIFDKDISRDLFPSILSQADLFMLTSKWEEYPISLVESMAVGTPFLSTPVGNAHILPGGITSRHKKELPMLLTTLINNPSYLNMLGEFAHKYAVENNAPNVIIKQLENILYRMSK